MNTNRSNRDPVMFQWTYLSTNGMVTETYQTKGFTQYTRSPENIYTYVQMKAHHHWKQKGPNKVANIWSSIFFNEDTWSSE